MIVDRTTVNSMPTTYKTNKQKNTCNQKKKHPVHFGTGFFKSETVVVASNLLPGHVQKCLLAHYQLVMTDASESQAWLLVDKVLRRERNNIKSFWIPKQSFERVLEKKPKTMV